MPQVRIGAIALRVRLQDPFQRGGQVAVVVLPWLSFPRQVAASKRPKCLPNLLDGNAIAGEGGAEAGKAPGDLHRWRGCDEGSWRR